MTWSVCGFVNFGEMIVNFEQPNCELWRLACELWHVSCELWHLARHHEKNHYTEVTE